MIFMDFQGISWNFMKIHENTRISWNSTKSREKGATLAAEPKMYWIPVGIQHISDAPAGYADLRCTGFHGIPGKSMGNLKILLDSA